MKRKKQLPIGVRCPTWRKDSTPGELYLGMIMKVWNMEDRIELLRGVLSIIVDDQLHELINRICTDDDSRETIHAADTALAEFVDETIRRMLTIAKDSPRTKKYSNDIRIAGIMSIVINIENRARDYVCDLLQENLAVKRIPPTQDEE